MPEDAKAPGNAEDGNTKSEEFVIMHGWKFKAVSVSRAFTVVTVFYYVVSLFSLLETYLGDMYKTSLLFLNLLAFFCIIHRTNKDAVEIYFWGMLFSVLFDMIALGLKGEDMIDSKSAAKFSVGMTVMALILKFPFLFVTVLEFIRRGGTTDRIIHFLRSVGPQRVQTKKEPPPGYVPEGYVPMGYIPAGYVKADEAQAVGGGGGGAAAPTPVPVNSTATTEKAEEAEVNAEPIEVIDV
eukprot:Nk52_evm1s1479 gene=Nk52_evmTU1s1479